MEYKNLTGKTLQQSIESEMSGNLENILVAIGKNITFLCLQILYSTGQKFGTTIKK